nr:MAG TPA: hypothetical protein [Caudoviricetes sp.]
MGKKKWYKTWWGGLLTTFFWFIVVPIIIFQSGLSKRNKILSFMGFIVFFWVVFVSISSNNQALEKNETDVTKTEVKKQTEPSKKKEENKVTNEDVKQNNEVRVTKNKENGDFVLQIIVPENATEEEISKILMDTAVANKKRFQGDNTMVVAYSDEHYMYKSLLGTHGQMRLINGGTDFIKISPKENINAEDKKDFKEYFDLYQGFKDFGDDDETARKETQTMLCGRNKERCKEIIKKSEKYFFDINKK